MKLLKHLLPIALLCLVLTACGGGEESTFDPTTTAESLLVSGGFSEQLEQVDGDIACAIYYMDASTVTESAVYCSTGATAEEIAVFILTDTDAATAAVSALEGRVSDQMAVLESYQPDEMVKLESAYIEQRGNSVLLVVANDIELAKGTLE